MQNEHRWEYQDLAIPLNFDDVIAYWMIAEAVNQHIRRYVRQAEQEGWQVEGPDDWNSLVQQGRSKAYKFSSFLRGEVFSFRGVTLRLKRAMAEPSVPARVQPPGCAT
jgi:hypothetical protein